MEIEIKCIGPHQWRGQILIEGELDFSIITFDEATCCQFIWQHKQFLDQTTVQNQRIEQTSERVH